MGQRVLIMGENKGSYMMKSISDAFTGHGFSVTLVDVKVKKATLQAEQPDILLMFVGEYISENKEAAGLIYEYAMTVAKNINLIGYRDEITYAIKMFKNNCIGRTFERPLNIGEMVDYFVVENEKHEETGGKKSILVVDDSGPSLRAIKGWLEEKYQISVSSSAAMAISFLAEHKPDLILLDYEMPICNGPQFLEMIRAEEKTSDIPVIFLTGKDDADSVKSVISLKPDGYLLKTLPPVKIIETVDQFFAKRG